MSNTNLIDRITAIQISNPENLMAKHFDADYFLSLEPDLQNRLEKIIASGIENPDSNMGAYAMNPQDYNVFSDLFDPMIRDFHNIPDGDKIAQEHDWDSSGIDCNLVKIDQRLTDVSMRVRVARNVEAYPLPGAMNKMQRIEFENTVAKAFSMLVEDPAFGGTYLSITPGSPYQIDHEEYQLRVASHQMFKDMSADRYLNVAGISGDWPHGRGMYISGEEDFLVWVGEEDHLRIMAMHRGSDLNRLFERLHSGLHKLGALLPTFATSTTYGSIASCPTNLGASMRASLHLKLPNITHNGGDLGKLNSIAKPLGLAVRGVGGEHSGAGEDGLVDISPSARLGVTEMQIMKRLYDGASELWQIETGSPTA